MRSSALTKVFVLHVSAEKLYLADKVVSDLWAVIQVVDDDGIGQKNFFRILPVPYAFNGVLFATGNLQ